ncbi:ABC transporter permease [Streptomyces sp. AV19]|uniref:ABC transporter permease n=1 Tax=Streptomyces sp. AV19 TaxID=2793068 RepID=UPI0035ABD0AD
MTAPLTPSPHDRPVPVSHEDLPPAPTLSQALRAELPSAAVVAAVVTVTGVLLGFLWLWLAPRVPLISDGRAVFLRSSEGEQAIGADGTFALLGLGFGAVAAAVVFLLRRAGGVGVVTGLAVGGLLGSLVAWRLGIWLGPTSDVVSHARAVGKGVVFDAPLRLGAKGMLLAFPMAAMAVHLVLTALFGPRDEVVPGPESAV